MFMADAHDNLKHLSALIVHVQQQALRQYVDVVQWCV